jgi:PAT family beta-lactamase induction signal transducer AmpG
VIANPFYRDTGFSKAEIATVSKIFGVWVGIAGAFLGGAVVSAWGVKKPLIPAAIAVAASNLLFINMSVFPGERWAFVLTIAGDNLSQGFGGTVLVAFMSSLASARYTATQYALMSSLANLPGRFIGGLSGFVVESTSYTTFFVFSTFSVLPTLLVLAWLWGRLEEAAPPEAAAAPGRSTEFWAGQPSAAFSAWVTSPACRFWVGTLAWPTQPLPSSGVWLGSSRNPSRASPPARRASTPAWR